MRNTFLTLFFACLILFSAAQENILLSSNFWKSAPTLEMVKAEIKKGNSPSEQNNGFFDPVVLAINNKADNEIIMFLILQEGNSVDKKTHHSRSYLHWAAAQGNLEIVRFLINNGANINYKDSYGEPIIAYAAGSNKNLDVFETLFDAGVSPTAKHQNGTTLIMYAIPSDTDLKITDYLISKGISLIEKDDFGRTVTDYAARLGNLDIIDQLIIRGIPITDQAQFFATFGSRQKQNNLEVYKALLSKYNLNPNAVNPEGENMLHALARRQNKEVFNYYLNQGVDPKKISNTGNTILMMAAAGKDLSIVESIIQKVNNINTVNENNESALTKAIGSGTADAVKLLIQNGADITIEDKEGNNLAYYWLNSYRPIPSLENMSTQMPDDEFERKLTILQNAGLEITTPQKDGRTLLHIAVEKENIHLIKKAIELGIDVNHQDEEGNTALHKAALIAKDDTILKLLIAEGIDKELKTEFDETAFELASQNDFLNKNSINIEFLK